MKPGRRLTCGPECFGEGGLSGAAAHFGGQPGAFGGVLFGFRRCLQERLVIVRPDGTHYPVPEQKVETIIAFEMVVVQIMTYRCVDPPADRATAESRGKELIAQVPIDIDGKTDQEKEEQMPQGDGDREEENDVYEGFRHGFQRMEGIGRPGCRIDRTMVYQVEQAE